MDSQKRFEDNFTSKLYCWDMCGCVLGFVVCLLSPKQKRDPEPGPLKRIADISGSASAGVTIYTAHHLNLVSCALGRATQAKATYGNLRM